MNRKCQVMYLVIGLLMCTLTVQAAEKNIELIVTGELGNIYYAFDGKNRDTRAAIQTCTTRLSTLREKHKAGIFVDTGNFAPPAFRKETSYTAAPVRDFKKFEFDVVAVNDVDVLTFSFFKKWQEFLGDILIGNINGSAVGDVHVLEPYRTITRNEVTLGFIGGNRVQLRGFNAPTYISPTNFEEQITSTFKTVSNKVDVPVLITDAPLDAFKAIIESDQPVVILHGSLAEGTEDTVTLKKESVVVKRSKSNTISRVSMVYDTAKNSIKSVKVKEFELPRPTNPLKYKPFDTDRDESFEVPQSVTAYLPHIGHPIENLERLIRFGISGEVVEINASTRRVPGVLRNNERIQTYVVKDGEKKFRLMYCLYRAGLGGPVFSFYIMFTPDGAVKYIKPTLPAYIGGKSLDMDDLYDSLMGKKVSEWNPQVLEMEEPWQPLAGLYQHLFVSFIRAIDAVNTVVEDEYPL